MIDEVWHITTKQLMCAHGPYLSAL